jgi:FixJ family two-component response regulator
VSTEPLIAVIDDDESFRTALVEALCSLGYGARSFASAEEFVTAGDAGLSDCIITDIHMPGMSGIDLKRLLVVRDCRVPVIMITARTEPALEALAVASGAVCVLKKPFETATLIGCLQSALKA